MSRKIIILYLVTLVTAMLLSGCSDGEKIPPQEKPQGQIDTYTIADSTGDWGFPSPFGHYDRGPGYMRMSFLFDTLVWKDAHGYVPALATKWTFDQEDNTYTIDLRQGVTWHDGAPFTARDVVFTVNYVSRYPYPLADISCIAAAEAQDDYTVRFKLKEPYAPFIEYVAGTLPILPEHIWRDVQKPEEFRDAAALVGTGPYKLLDYNKEHGTYLYAANEKYYGGKPLVNKIRFIKVGKEMAHAALQKGEVNATEVPPEVIENLQQAGLTVISGPHFWNTKLLINHQKEPFTTKELRQALAYAIDREELARVVARGHAAPASPGMLPPDSEWHNPDVEQYQYNPAKTKELLQGLGYTLQDDFFYKNGKPLSLELLVSQPYARDGEIIATQLGKAGVKVSLKSLEAKTLDNKVENWEFDLAFSGHGALGGDPIILNRMITGQGFLSARYQANQDLNKLLAAQVKAMDLEARKELVRRAQAVYAEDVPALSLYYPRWYFGHDGGIELYYTKGGVASGVPLPLNKMCFVSPQD